MKTTLIFKTVAVAAFIAFMGGCHHHASAQQKGEAKKETYRIKLIDNQNGVMKEVDTTFSNAEDMHKYMKAHMPKDVDVNIDLKNMPDIKEDDIVIKQGDSMIRKKIVTREIHIDSTGDIKNLVDDDMLDIIKNSLPEGEMRTVKIMAFIKLDDAGSDELKNSNSKEMQNTLKEKPLVLENVNAYPNPNNGQLNISFELPQAGQVQLLVTDIQGKEIVKKEFNAEKGMQQQTLDLSGHSEGVYLLKIKTGDKSTVKKIMLN